MPGQHATGTGGGSRPLGPLRRGTREVGLGLVVLGFIVLLFVAYQLFGTNLTESHNQHRLAKTFTHALHVSQAGADSSTIGSSTSTEIDPSVPLGSAIAHLIIPKIGVDKYVVEGVADDDLDQGPGHYPGTPLPGQVGNVAIAGHRTTYGAPFFRLDELAPGDDIYITDTTGSRFVYQVASSEVVQPDDVSVLDATSDAELTLTTCNPKYGSSSRLVVVAKLVGTPAPVAAAPKVVSPSTPRSADRNLTAGTSSAWPPALLYGGLVVVGWVMVRVLINRSRRWARLAAYVLGIGVCLVPLWFCFENVVRILPPSL
jgi:sortase A